MEEFSSSTRKEEEGGRKNWQQPLLKMDLCKKLQSYLNTIFLGMASLLTASLLLLSCSLRAVFFRESDLTVNLRKINFPNIE